jgi:hypothetical protein
LGVVVVASQELRVMMVGATEALEEVLFTCSPCAAYSFYLHCEPFASHADPSRLPLCSTFLMNAGGCRQKHGE